MHGMLNRVTGRHARVWMARVGLVLGSVSLIGCSPSESPSDPASESRSVTAQPAPTVSTVNPLRVIIRTSPVTFWGQPWGLAGMELEMAKALAERLDRPLETLALADDQMIVDTLHAKQADIAMASLPALSLWSDRLHFSHPVIDARYVLVHPKSRGELNTETDIETLEPLTVAIEGNSSASAFAREYPQFIGKIRAYDDVDVFTLLAKTAQGLVPMVLTQASKFQMVQSIYPTLTTSEPIGGDVALGWAIAHNGDRALLDAANALLGRMRRSGSLTELMEKYLPGNPLKPVDERTFNRHIAERLSLYWAYFEQAADLTEQDPLLLAAVGYQESHWRRRAKSPTGVRGVMMLTQATSKEMGVTNRLDAKQSIVGGAKYLRKMRDRLPERIAEPDRTYLALAAYNLGYGHLSDVRKLTQKLGGNPDRWQDVRDVLPLKADKAYYPDTKFGYARGWEPVTYVDNIQNYYNALLIRDSQLNELAFKEEAQ